MARDMRDIAQRKDAAKPAAAPVCAAPPNTALAKTPPDAEDREALSAIWRAPIMNVTPKNPIGRPP